MITLDTLFNWIINEPIFSYPIIIFLCFQVAKIITAGFEKRTNILFSIFRYMGGDICVICIPIVITNWGNKNSELYKKFGQHNPTAVGLVTVVLAILAAACIWVGHIADVPPKDQKIAKWLL